MRNALAAIAALAPIRRPARQPVLERAQMSAGIHAHHWTTRSRHRTSQGVITYDQCACGRWRVQRDNTDLARQTLAVTSAGSPPDRRAVSGPFTP
jgi:hypothetical protein